MNLKSEFNVTNLMENLLLSEEGTLRDQERILSLTSDYTAPSLDLGSFFNHFLDMFGLYIST